MPKKIEPAAVSAAGRPKLNRQDYTADNSVSNVAWLALPDASLGDFAWFAARPHRRYRLRRAFRGEAKGRGVAGAEPLDVLIHQVAPGEHRVLLGHGVLAACGHDDDEALGALYNEGVESILARARA